MRSGDLAALGVLFNANWEQVENKVPFGIELVDEARTVGANLLHAIGITNIGEVRRDTRFDWLSLRARAFRLLINEYEELRRAATYVRWHHGDAQAFAPSLHSGARKRRRGQDEEGTTVAEVALVGSEDAPLAGDAEVKFAANPGAVSTATGMPGSSPFEER